MTNDEIHAIYDAMMTAEASGDYATASRLLSNLDSTECEGRHGDSFVYGTNENHLIFEI
jgi:hypothetical protein